MEQGIMIGSLGGPRSSGDHSPERSQEGQAGSRSAENASGSFAAPHVDAVWQGANGRGYAASSALLRSQRRPVHEDTINFPGADSSSSNSRGLPRRQPRALNLNDEPYPTPRFISLDFCAAIPEQNPANAREITKILDRLGRNYFSEGTTRVCETWIRKPVSSTITQRSALSEEVQRTQLATFAQRFVRHCGIFWAVTGRLWIWPLESAIAWYFRAAIKNILVALPRLGYVGVNGVFSVPFGAQAALYGYFMLYKAITGRDPSMNKGLLWALALAGIYWMIQGTPAGAPTLPLYVHVIGRAILREVFRLSVTGCKVPHLVTLSNVDLESSSIMWQQKLMRLSELENEEDLYKKMSLQALDEFLDALIALYHSSPSSNDAFTTQDSLNLIRDFDQLVGAELHPYICNLVEFESWANTATPAESDACTGVRERIDAMKNDLIGCRLPRDGMEDFLDELTNKLPEHAQISSELTDSMNHANLAGDTALDAVKNLLQARSNLIRALFYKHVFRDVYQTAVQSVISANVHETDESRGATAIWCVVMAVVVGGWYFWNPQMVPIKPKPAETLGLAESWFFSSKKKKPWVLEWPLLPNFEYVNIGASAIAELVGQLGKIGRTLYLYASGGRVLVQLGSVSHHQSFSSSVIKRRFIDKLINSKMPGFSTKTSNATWENLRPLRDFATEGTETDKYWIAGIPARAWRYVTLPFIFSAHAGRCLLPNTWPLAYKNWDEYKIAMAELFSRVPGSEELAFRQTLYNVFIVAAYRGFLLTYMGVIAWCKDKWPDPVVLEDMATRIANTVVAPPAFVGADGTNDAFAKFWSFLSLGISRADAVPLSEPEPESSRSQRTWREWFAQSYLGSSVG